MVQPVGWQLCASFLTRDKGTCNKTTNTVPTNAKTTIPNHRWQPKSKTKKSNHIQEKHSKEVRARSDRIIKAVKKTKQKKPKQKRKATQTLLSQQYHNVNVSLDITVTLQTHRYRSDHDATTTSTDYGVRQKPVILILIIINSKGSIVIIHDPSE